MKEMVGQGPVQAPSHWADRIEYYAQQRKHTTYRSILMVCRVHLEGGGGADEPCTHSQRATEAARLCYFES